MSAKKSFFFKLSVVAVVFLTVMVVISSVLMTGKPGTLAPPMGGARHRVGNPHDWTHHYVVYSNPGTYDQVKNDPAASSRLYRIQYDTRYILQQQRRNASLVSSAAIPQISLLSSVVDHGVVPPIAKRSKTTINRDWSVKFSPSTSVGAGQYPATYAIRGNCTGAPADFAVFNTGITGGASQATIVAYDNLYSGCGGGVPTVYWQYNTSYLQNSSTTDTSSVSTSVVLSLDGSQVAFVESTTTKASLVLLKWKSSSTLVLMNSAGTNNVLPASYRTCVAPCMTRIPFSTSTSDTTSAPFYDYFGDAIYVGDSGGNLHKFVNIFNSGTPGESGSPWPFPVSGSPLAPPVYDGNTGNIFIGDAGGTLWYVRDSISTTGTCSSGSVPCIGSPSLALGGAITDAPLVDVTNGTVFVTDGTSDYGACATAFAGPPVAPLYGVVAQTNEALVGPSGSGNAIVLCIGGKSTGTPNPMYSGAFNNNYYNNAEGVTTGANLYVCGRNRVNQNYTALYPLTFTPSGGVSVLSATIPTPLAIDSTGSSEPDVCSVSEFYNSGKDWLFVSTASHGDALGGSCTTGSCLYSFDITSALGTSASASINVLGGTSGIVIDNALSSPTGTSNIYFSPLGTTGTCTTSGGTGGCAIQASQATLSQ